MDKEKVKLLIGQRIKQKREEKGLTQAQLAEKIEMSTNFIGMVERGERNTKFTNIYEIADVLGYSLEEFFKGL